MKNKSVTILILLLTVINVTCLMYIHNQQKLLLVTNQQTHPTQDEWLKVYISHNIYKITDLWTQRVSVTVDIFTKDSDGKPVTPKEIIIGITSANGEKILNDGAKQQYIDMAKMIAERIISDYKLENDYKLSVQSLF